MSEIVKSTQPEVLVHLASQVAVTLSVEDPLEDFRTNAGGTFNLLDAVRLHSPHTFFINASTNKVYGKLDSLDIDRSGNQYVISNLPTGVSE